MDQVRKGLYLVAAAMVLAGCVAALVILAGVRNGAEAYRIGVAVGLFIVLATTGMLVVLGADRLTRAFAKVAQTERPRQEARPVGVRPAPAAPEAGSVPRPVSSGRADEDVPKSPAGQDRPGHTPGSPPSRSSRRRRGGRRRPRRPGEGAKPAGEAGGGSNAGTKGANGAASQSGPRSPAQAEALPKPSVPDERPLRLSDIVYPSRSDRRE